MEGTLVLLYNEPENASVMNEFLKVIHGFPKAILVVCDSTEESRREMIKIQNDARSMGLSLIELPGIAQAKQLFSPNHVMKTETEKIGKFDPTEIAAKLNNGETVMIAFGDDLSDIEGEVIHIEQALGPVGTAAIVLHEIWKFLEHKE